MKTFHFLNGMPRSGSTLLANILNQNPKFRATPTSGLCSLMLQANNVWSNIPEIRASATPQNRIDTLRGMLEGFHTDVEQEVVFSKSRGWVCAAEMMRNVLGREPKFICTVRDIPSILSSCEKLFRKELSSPESNASWGANMETIEGRLAFWSQPDQLVGGSYNRLRDCVRRGFRKNMHFVDFDSLTQDTESEMKKVYDFIDEPFFEGHDFVRVTQSTHEKDSEHGFVDLHTIRPSIQPVKKDYRAVLGDAVKPYMGFSYDFI